MNEGGALRNVYYPLSGSIKLIVALTIFGVAIGSASAKAEEKTETKDLAVKQSAVPSSVQIDKNGTLILIRSVLFTLDLANKTGNYSILRDIGAPGFAASNDTIGLMETFKKMREEKADISGVLVYEPTLTMLPFIDKDGFLRMGGYFPSPTSQINFELMFAPVNGRWKIMGFNANVGPSGPLAPMQMVSKPGSNQNQSLQKK